MIFRLDDDTWLLYATGKRGRDGAVTVCVSENLLDWRFVRFALRTTPPAPKQPPWAATESPFVFRKDGEYWLSHDLHHEHGRARASTTTRCCSARRTRSTSGVYSGDPPSRPRGSRRTRPSISSIPTRAGGTSRAPAGPATRFGTVIPGSVAIRELDWG